MGIVISISIMSLSGPQGEHQGVLVDGNKAQSREYWVFGSLKLAVAWQREVRGMDDDWGQWHYL
jgi:hypothetical protein